MYVSRLKGPDARKLGRHAHVNEHAQTRGRWAEEKGRPGEEFPLDGVVVDKQHFLIKKLIWKYFFKLDYFSSFKLLITFYVLIMHNKWLSNDLINTLYTIVMLVCDWMK